MDKEQVILERLEQLRQDQLKALKELKKVEKAKKRKHRRSAHGYPRKDSSSEQTKMHAAGDRSAICVLGTTPGRRNFTFMNREVGNNENQTPGHGKLTSLTTSERKSLKETSLNVMVETPLKKQAISDIDHHGLMTDDQAEIRNVEAHYRTTTHRQESVGSTAETVERKVTSKVTEMLDWMSFKRMEDSVTHGKETVTPSLDIPTTCNNKETIIISDTGVLHLTSAITCNKETVIPDTGASCLRSPIAHNKETVIIPDTCASCLTSPITCNKETVISDTDASCLTSPITCSKKTFIPDIGASCLTSSITRNKETAIPDTCASCLTSPITRNKETVIRDTDTSCLTNPITHDKETVIPDAGASCLTGSLTHKKRTVIPVPSVIPDTGSSSCSTSSVTHSKLTITSDSGGCCLIGSVSHCKNTVRLPDAGDSCLTDPIVHSKDTVNHDKNGSCPTGSQPHENPRQTAPSQNKKDEHFRFPKPDDCLLKTNGVSDFVLPDKDFAVLKLEKLKQVRQSDLKEKTDVKFGKCECQPDSSTNGSVVKCTTNNQNDCDDFQNSMATAADGQNDHDVYDSSQNTRNKGMLQSRKYDRSFESHCNVSPKNPNNASVEDQFQNVFSESLLDVLVAGDQDFFKQKTCDGCTWQAIDEKETSGQHLSSDVLSANAISEVVGAHTNDLNSGEGDVSTPKTSSNFVEFCGDLDRTIEEKHRCKNVNGLMFREKAVEEDKQVAQSIVASSTLTISQRHDDEDVMNRAMAAMSSNVASSHEKDVAENHNVCHSQSKVDKNEAGSGDSAPEMSEFCFQHLYKLPRSSNEVRALKSLTLRNGETASQIMAVCLPRLLVLWKSTAGSMWIVLHKWVLNEEEEFFELEITSVDSCVVVLAGGRYSKSLGSNSETVYEFKHMCLLPTKESVENLTVVLACSKNDGRILLTKWKIDLMCFCIEESKEFPELCGSHLSSLLTVDGTTCLLLGCLHSDIYLWNYNSCELVCKTSIQFSAVSRPICLSAETSMGILFLVLFYKTRDEAAVSFADIGGIMASRECKEVKLVAVNPQSERAACLKTLDMAQIIEDPSDRVLFCSKRGSFVVSSFTRGHILLWNIASDKTKLLNLFSDDVTSILVDHEESSIAFGTVSGSVYLNIMK